MKRVIFAIIFAITINTILAQTYNMKIKQGSGIAYSVTSTVDEITFINTSTTPFVCGDVILYGGETYSTVLIGSQCWFQKNLNIGTRIDGSSNPEDNSIIEKYCYSDLDANCITYGGSYKWDETMQYSTTPGVQGICPPGWHIPTSAEFETLGDVVGDNNRALKAIGQGTLLGPGTNTSGFSVLMAGTVPDGFITYYAGFWSSTEYDATRARNMQMFDSDTIIEFSNWPKSYGFSVRCLKD